MQDELLRGVHAHAPTGAGAVNVVRFTHDGNYCLTGGDDKTIRLFNPHKGMKNTSAMQTGPEKESALFIKAYSGTHGYSILDISIAQDKTKFVSAGEDRSFYLWDVTSGNVLKRIQGHTQKINAVALNKDATVVVTASYDQTVRCWDLRSNNREPIQTMSDFKDSVTSLALTDSAIVAGSVDGYVRTYDMRVGVLQQDYLRDPVTSVRLSDDHKTYLAACLDASTSTRGSTSPSNGTGTLHLVDMKSGCLLKQYTGHTHRSLKVEAAFENDQKHVLCADEAGAIVHWDLLSGKEVARTPPGVHGHSKGCSALAYHPSLPVYLTSSYDGTVNMWRSSVSTAIAGRADSDSRPAGSYEKRAAATFFAKK